MKKRFISPFSERRSSCYHVVTRVVDRNFVLHREELDKMVQIIRKYEFFCGVQVNSFCVMSNHIHILVEVPPKKKGAGVEMSDEDFLERLKVLYSSEYYAECEFMLNGFRVGPTKSDVAAEEFKKTFTRRMCDLSEFMKGVKQSFSRWFNNKHQRVGTLWESRFTSVIVEDGYAARVMSAYIDLNPVRAGMVSRPEDYRWCSYGEAMKPKADSWRALARAGLCRVMQLNQETGGRVSPEDSRVAWEDKGAAWYRTMLFSDGEEVFVSRPEYGIEMACVRKGFKRKDVEAVLAKGGKLSFGEALRCKVRYLSDGMVFGTRGFVDQVFLKAKERFGEKRKSGARPMKEVGWHGDTDRLYTMRALNKDVME